MNASTERTAERIAVVCLAHGSRHPGTAAAVNRISEAVAELTGVETCGAHLDFSPRNLTAVAADLRAKSYDEAIVVPLLFTEAFHLRHDIPTALARATEATSLRFRLARQVGTGSDVAELLASRIPPNTDNLIVYSVGSSVEDANIKVAELVARVGSSVGVAASGITATGPGDTGPGALLAAVRLTPGTVHIMPLFISPGTLWDAACRVAEGNPNTTLGEPLDVAIAAVIAARVQAQLQCSG